MQEKAFYRGLGMDWTFQAVQDRGQRVRWKAASSAGMRVPLPIPSLVSSGRKLRGPENPALCCRPTFVCPCVCLRLSVFVLCVSALSLVLFHVCFVCVCQHCLWSCSLLVTIGRPETLLSQRSPKDSSHNPTWDDCQQLLQVLFTTEERERILAEARKRVPGTDGRPTTQPHLVDEGFPLLRPNWDFERVEGRERLRVYPRL